MQCVFVENFYSILTTTKLLRSKSSNRFIAEFLPEISKCLTPIDNKHRSHITQIQTPVNMFFSETIKINISFK